MRIAILLIAILGAFASEGQHPMRSIREFGVAATKDAKANAAALQTAIDWASANGAALYVEPSDEPYAIEGGIILRANASLVGAHGPVGRGTRHATKKQPVGSVFAIRDRERPFLTVQSSTQVRGVQFWYPEQPLDDPAKVIAYPATIQVARDQNVFGVTLSCLTFYGEYLAMDFNASGQAICEQILFEHCYGYPLSGEFIRIDYCYDIPRILHCHVNPANQRCFAGDMKKAMIDAVMARRTFAYQIDHTDNGQCIDLFTFGTWGGIRLGGESYGQLTNFNFDCVCVGVHKLGNNDFNRNWQISQGSIIANAGGALADIHPLIVEGRGHTAFSNVECFSAGNGALTFVGQSQDFLRVRGDQRLTISLVGCRMRNYAGDAITVENPRALVRAVACIDRDERLYEKTIGE